MSSSTARLLLCVMALLPWMARAQPGGSGGVRESNGMGMCPLCGPAAGPAMIAGILLVLAGAAALIALTVYLLRRSRPA